MRFKFALICIIVLCIIGAVFADRLVEPCQEYMCTPKNIDFSGTGKSAQYTAWSPAAGVSSTWTELLSWDFDRTIPQDRYYANTVKDLRAVLVDLNLEAIAVSGTPNLWWRLEAKNNDADDWTVLNSSIKVSSSNNTVCIGDGGNSVTTTTINIADGVYTTTEYAALLVAGMEATEITTATCTWSPTTRLFTITSDLAIYIDASGGNGEQNLGFLADTDHAGATSITGTYEVPSQLTALSTSATSLTVDGFLPLSSGAFDEAPFTLRITGRADTANVAKMRARCDSYVTYYHDHWNQGAN